MITDLKINGDNTAKENNKTIPHHRNHLNEQLAMSGTNKFSAMAQTPLSDNFLTGTHGARDDEEGLS